jgi:hypothetical protein
MTCGPATQISPCSPCGTSLSGFFSEAIFTVVPGIGRPMESGL